MAVGDTPSRTRTEGGSAPARGERHNGRYSADLLVRALGALVDGDFSVRLPDVPDPALQRITDAFTAMVKRRLDDAPAP